MKSVSRRFGCDHGDQPQGKIVEVLDRVRGGLLGLRLGVRYGARGLTQRVADVHHDQPHELSGVVCNACDPHEEVHQDHLVDPLRSRGLAEQHFHFSPNFGVCVGHGVSSFPEGDGDRFWRPGGRKVTDSRVDGYDCSDGPDLRNLPGAKILLGLPIGLEGDRRMRAEAETETLAFVDRMARLRTRRIGGVTWHTEDEAREIKAFAAGKGLTLTQIYRLIGRRRAEIRNEAVQGATV